MDAQLDPEERRRRRGIELGAFTYSIRPLAVDLGSTLTFYAVFALTGSLAVATGSGLTLGVVQLGWMRWRRRRIAAMQWAMLLLVGLVGGLGLILNDARPLLFKASAAYLIVGAAMLQPGWIERYVPPIALANVPRRLVVALGYVWAALIIGTGLLNLALTLTMPATRVAAVMVVWAPVSKLALFAAQYLWFRTIVRRRLGVAG